MAITLTLEPQEEAQLIAKAEAKGISAEMLAREAVRGLLDSPQSRSQLPNAQAENLPGEESRKDSRPIWEVIRQIMKDVPEEELARLPKDGASQVDHYLYGHAKRFE